MSKINVCQGCYRILLHENTTVLGISIGDMNQKLDFCLQCAGNLIVGDLNQNTLIEFSKNCASVRNFLDPIGVKRCGLCTYYTAGSYCYECNWKILRKNCSRWMINILSKYVDFEDLFLEDVHAGDSYLIGKII